LDATSVVVLVPVPRPLYDETVKVVGGGEKLTPAVLSAPQSALNALTLGWSSELAPAPAAGFSAPGWAAVVKDHAAERLVWYARRRNLKHTTKAGEAVVGPTVEPQNEPSIYSQLAQADQTQELPQGFSDLLVSATVQALEEAARLLASPRVATSRS